MENTGDTTNSEEVRDEMESGTWPFQAKAVQISRGRAFEYGSKTYTSIRLVAGATPTLKVDGMYYLSNGDVLAQKGLDRFVIPASIIGRIDLKS